MTKPWTRNETPDFSDVELMAKNIAHKIHQAALDIITSEIKLRVESERAFDIFMSLDDGDSLSADEFSSLTDIPSLAIKRIVFSDQMRGPDLKVTSEEEREKVMTGPCRLHATEVFQLLRNLEGEKVRAIREFGQKVFEDMLGKPDDKNPCNLVGTRDTFF